jgi:hypothetical protein
MERSWQTTSKRCTWVTGSRVEAADCFVLAQVILAPDDTGTMRIAASVGDGPLYAKFMKSEEAAYQSQTEQDAAIQGESERRQQFVLSQQQHYPALPATNGNRETIDAAYLRKLSTINYPLFKRLVQKHGSGNVTSRLRGEN